MKVFRKFCAVKKLREGQVFSGWFTREKFDRKIFFKLAETESGLDFSILCLFLLTKLSNFCSFYRDGLKTVSKQFWKEIIFVSNAKLKLKEGKIFEENFEGLLETT
jgi:hypothetical protein